MFDPTHEDNRHNQELTGVITICMKWKILFEQKQLNDFYSLNYIKQLLEQKWMIEIIDIHPCCEIQGTEDARVDVDFVDGEGTTVGRIVSL